MVLDWKRLLIAALLVPGCGDDAVSGGDGGDDDTSDSADPGSTDADSGDTGDSGDAEGDDDPSAEVEVLEPTLHLVRASMALRGVRPSVDELQRVADDPDTLPEIVDEYLGDPRFGETIRELHNDALLVSLEQTFPSLPPLQDVGSRTIGAAVMHGPLRLVEYVVTNDRPYTEIVTADYAIIDELTAQVAGMSYDPGGPALQQSAYEDRPAAGVLSDAAFFIRHRSAGANYHRGRANAVSKALLCHDFLDADVEIDGEIDLSDPDAVNDAVTNNEACVSCHQSMDPLGSFFWGYPGNLNPNQIPAYPVGNLYNPNAEDNWQFTTERPPSYFGQPAEGLGDLGQLIADDPRFSLCAAQRFYAFFHQIDLDEVPLPEAAVLQAVLVDSGFDAKAMVREIVLSDEFRASHGLTDEAAEDLVGLKMARPSQLARLMDDLTGFRWEANLDQVVPNFNEGDVDLVRTNFLGFAVLAGGMDSFFVEQVANTVNTTTSLFLRAYAGEAASYTAEHDLLDAPEASRLLTLVDAQTSDEDAVRQQLQALHQRLFAEDIPADDPRIDDSWTLWSAALDRSGDPVLAWKTTLTAMLQDLRIIFY